MVILLGAIHRAWRHPKTTALLLGMLTLITWAILPACKKSNGSSSSVTATIGNTSFQSTSLTGTYYTHSGGFTLIGYQVAKGDTTFVGMTFWSPFQFNVPFSTDTTLVSLVYSIDNGAAYYEAYSPNNLGHAIITVTSWDSTQRRIAGTFSGSVASIRASDDTLAVTNGKFSATYVESY